MEQSDMKKNRTGLKQLRYRFYTCGTDRDTVFSLASTQKSGKTMGLFTTEYSYSQHLKRTNKTKKTSSASTPALIITDHIDTTERVPSEDVIIPVGFDTRTHEFMLEEDRELHPVPSLSVALPRTTDPVPWFNTAPPAQLDLPLRTMLEPDLVGPVQVRLHLCEPDTVGHPRMQFWQPEGWLAHQIFTATTNQSEALEQALE